MTRKPEVVTNRDLASGIYELFGIYFNGPKATVKLQEEYPGLPAIARYDGQPADLGVCSHCGVPTFYGAILLAYDGTADDALLLGYVTIAEECAKDSFPDSVEQFAKLKNFGRRHRRASARPPAASPAASVPTQGTKPAPLGKNVTIEGVVLSVVEKVHPKYGPQNKMTVQCDGYRVYATVPAAIAPEVNLETGKGKKVRFSASVTLSKTDPDPFFAFAVYPKNAQVL